MKISIISPVYENPEQLKILLQSIERAIDEIRCGYEVLIVDDGSKADIKSITDKFSFAHYIMLPINKGPAAARNTGARAASGDFLMFFDSDVVLKNDTLKQIEDTIHSGAEIFVGEYDEEPANRGFFPKFKTFITKSWTPRAEYVSPFALRAACIKKTIFEEVNGFDENIKTPSVEDYEFGDRLAAKGYKIRYNPQILVYHHHPSFKKQSKVFYERARDLVLLLSERNWKPYDWCASHAEGLSSVSGALFLIFLLPAVILRSVILGTASLILFIMFLISNRTFMQVIIKEKKIWFIPLAIIVKLALCVPITAGGGVGFLVFLRKKVFKR